MDPSHATHTECLKLGPSACLAATKPLCGADMHGAWVGQSDTTCPCPKCVHRFRNKLQGVHAKTLLQFKYCGLCLELIRNKMVLAALTSEIIASCELQSDFFARVEKLEGVRAHHRQSIRHLGPLFHWRAQALPCTVPPSPPNVWNFRGPKDLGRWIASTDNFQSIRRNRKKGALEVHCKRTVLYT